MIVSLYIILLIISVIIFLLGVYDENIVFQLTSMMLFMALMAFSFYITVPFIAATNSTTYTITEHQYIESGLSVIYLIFIFVDLILIASEFVERRRKRQGPYIPGQ